jgi:nonsense-mediated mRNA decay protein 3
MTSTGEFCVVCGRTGRPLTDGVCAECASERAELVALPRQIEVVLCPQCGARWSRGHWERAGASPVLTSEDLQPQLVVHPEVGIRSLSWEERSRRASIREITGEAKVRFRGIERTIPLSTSARVIARSCTECGRRSGHYYTALLQLRGEAAPRTRRPKELRQSLASVWQELVREARPDWRSAVGWREELREGWDVYFTDTLAARSVARLAKQRFGVPVTESASLFGRKNGQDVYRVTFCLRFPPATLESVPRAPSAPVVER